MTNHSELLTSAFHEDLILFHPTNIDTKKKCFELISHSFEAWNSGLKHRHVLNALYNRERIGHTAIAPNVAIPHARISSLTTPVGIITALKDPINYDTHESIMVKMLFTLLVPEDATDIHLNLLADLAKHIKQTEWIDSLMQSKNIHELWTNFCKK